MTEFTRMGVVELRPIGELKPFEKNAKLHPKEQIEALKKSIKDIGFRNKPIEITEDGTIVNGHGRWQALKELKAENAPVVVVDDMTPEEIRKYRISDNKIGDTGLDNVLLKEEVAELHLNLGMDMSDLFTEKDMDFLVGDLDAMDLDAITGDLADDVEDLSTATQNSIDAEGEKSVPVAKAFGFSSVSESQLRSVSRLMAHAEGVTEKSDADALVEFIKDHLGL